MLLVAVGDGIDERFGEAYTKIETEPLTFETGLLPAFEEEGHGSIDRVQLVFELEDVIGTHL
jgi:hypothetical protein